MKSILVSLALTFSVSAQALSIDPITYVSNYNNKVGLTLMKEVSAAETLAEKNVLTSPLSLYLALSMAYNGAGGATEAQFASLINPLNDREVFNDIVRHYQDSTILAEVAPRYPDMPKSPVLGLYNSAWSNTAPSPSGGNFSFAPAFLQRLTDSYSAEHQALNFNDTASADVLNAWADAKTKGLIPHIIDADTLKKFMWILMNATYFEANWDEPFYVLGDAVAPKFNLLNGQQKQVPMIRNNAYMVRMDVDDLDVVEIPFYGSNISFYIANPKSPADFATLNKDKAWAPDFWSTIMNRFHMASSQKGSLTMPKFSFGYNVTLKKDEPLTIASGLNFMFDDRADFSAIGTPDSVPTAVGLIKQDARIELDENGVKAAAVTMIGGIEVTSVGPQDPFEMVVDQPFFFAIADKTTGTLIFVGSVVDPTLK